MGSRFRAACPALLCHRCCRLMDPERWPSLPALVAMRAIPTLRAFAGRLRATGKRPKVIVVAVMRKLLLFAWTILRSGQPYSPTYQSASTALAAD